MIIVTGCAGALPDTFDKLDGITTTITSSLYLQAGGLVVATATDNELIYHLDPKRRIVSRCSITSTGLCCSPLDLKSPVPPVPPGTAGNHC